jgi:hypothetical protein
MLNEGYNMDFYQTLQENMMRFSTKNLSKRDEDTLVARSIVETIKQYGLQNDVIYHLVREQATPPATPTPAPATTTPAAAPEDPAEKKQILADLAKKIAELEMDAIKGAGEAVQDLMLKLTDIIKKRARRPKRNQPMKQSLSARVGVPKF